MAFYEACTVFVATLDNVKSANSSALVPPAQSLSASAAGYSHTA